MNTPTPLNQIPWLNQFTQNFPGDPESGNFTRAVSGALYSAVAPTPVKSPTLLTYSRALCAELGLAPLENDHKALEILAGNHVPPTMKPYAARYGGHQFGHWAGQLGDGRAITLCDGRLGQRGELWELQLKGAGPTPYSRRGDGRAVLRSSLREYLCSEAMHALGVPTTRALSLVATGEGVVRDMFYDGNPRVEPGAIVCRVAPSFLRFGNWQILAAHDEIDLCRKLTRYTIENFYPDLDAKAPTAVADFFKTVCEKTASLMAHWMRVGFVHGVMNTDNMSVLGLTIDYGPYGWLEPFDPNWTPNTTDAQGRRYRFGAQPQVALWNLARFGEALLCLGEATISEAQIHEGLDAYRKHYEQWAQRHTAAKLGLGDLSGPLEKELVEKLFPLMADSKMDFTLFFRTLCQWSAQSAPQEDSAFVKNLFDVAGDDTALFTSCGGDWIQWLTLYRRALSNHSGNDDAADMVRRNAMLQANPKYVLRNYLAKKASDLAENGDLSLLRRLETMLAKPYDEQPEFDDLAVKRPTWAANTPGAATLSCSS